MDYKQIYEKIIDTDPNIRLVTICDPNGKIMYSSHREGVKNLLTRMKVRDHLSLPLIHGKHVASLNQK